jgi:hypothetical protein
MIRLLFILSIEECGINKIQKMTVGSMFSDPEGVDAAERISVHRRFENICRIFFRSGDAIKEILCVPPDRNIFNAPRFSRFS